MARSGLRTADDVRGGRVLSKLGADGAVLKASMWIAAALAILSTGRIVFLCVEWARGPHPFYIGVGASDTWGLPAGIGFSEDPPGGSHRVILWERPTAEAFGLHMGGQLLAALAVVLVAGAYAWFAWSIHRGKPFTVAYRVAATVAVAGILAGTWGVEFLDHGMQWEAVDALANALGPKVDTPGFDVQPQGTNIILWPFAVICVLGLLDVAFAYGRRLEEDTEGLV